MKLTRAAGRLLIALGVALLATTLPAMAATLTLTWTGASWNDGGSLSGTFTVDYNDITGAPISLVSADVVTGNGTSDGFPGQTYLYNVSGYANTVSFEDFDAAQNLGAPANELEMSLASSPYLGYTIYLDWLGTDPTSLWVGTVGGQYSSEDAPYQSQIRSLNSEGGSAGSSTPEPATVMLTGVALVGAAWLRRRRT